MFVFSSVLRLRESRGGSVKTERLRGAGEDDQIGRLSGTAFLMIDLKTGRMGLIV